MVKINNWFSINLENNNLVKITFSESATDSEFDQYLIFYKNLYNDNNKYVIIFDASLIKYISPSQVFKKLILMQNMRPIHKTYLNYFYVVVTTAYTRNLLDKAFTLVPPVAPYKICNNLDECIKIENV
tara:strand:+ start:92 stop:475 length:384 start_codon:yes stop_codon:yes gene_type:complete